MPNAISGAGFSASANVRTNRLVKIDATSGNDFMVKECGAGDLPIGVSQDGSNAPPGLVAALAGSETLYAAQAGQQLTVFTAGDNCKLVLGTGGCASGDKLKSDANGAGVVAAVTDSYGAVAKGAGLAGELVDVIVQPGLLHA